MDTLQAILLALVQGITEFLPISSSAHLVLPKELFGWPDQGLAFDVAVHLGSLLAVLWYFRNDLIHLTGSTLTWLGRPTRHLNRDLHLVRNVVLATLPVLLAGLLVKDLVAADLRSMLVIAITTIGFALALWLADTQAGQRSEYELSVGEALLVGAAQMLALVPGVSRSGITMTAGLFLGMRRESAARFSFLLSIPTILGAGLLLSIDLVTTPGAVQWDLLAIGTAVAGLSAYACISLFIGLLERTGMTPYVIYRLLLGMVLLGIWFS